MKKVEAQKKLDQVSVNEWKLENVYNFCYLGHHLQADGDASYAMEVRLAIAKRRFGELHHIWNSKELPMRLKLQLYASGVCSILTHSHEAWKLTHDTCRKLQAWNGLNLAIIEANKLAEPDDPDSFRDLIRLQTIMPVYDLVTTLRVRRLAWVGHILRKEESAWTRKVLLLFNEIYPGGYPEGSGPTHGCPP